MPELYRILAEVCLGKTVKELYPYCIKLEINESKYIKPNANFLVHFTYQLPN